MSYTFGGYPLEMRVVGDDVLIQCKSVIGAFSQLKAWKTKKNAMTNLYPFGIKTTEPTHIRLNPISKKVEIACLEGTMSEFNAAYEECKRLLNI